MNWKIAYLGLIISCLAGCVAFGNSSDTEYLKQAEEFSRQHKFTEAIAAYEKHMQRRLKLKDRPEWENPNLYYLMIGDLYLAQNQVDKALNSYEEAEKNGVDIPLVSDRYRYVARWYETRGELNESVTVLTKYRDRDSLLFDAMLDRLSKQIVEQESLSIATPAPTP